MEYHLYNNSGIRIGTATSTDETLEGEVVVLKKAANSGSIELDDNGQLHYFCHCNTNNPEELTHKHDTCPRCGKKVTHFRRKI